MLIAKLYIWVVTMTALVTFVSHFQSVAQTIVDPTPAVIYVRNNGALELNGTASGSLGNLKQLDARLKKLFSEREKSTEEPSKTIRQKSSCYTTPVVIRVDESWDYGSIADFIVHVRAAGADPIRVQASHNQDGTFLTVPQEPCPDQDLSLLKPNPLTLVVRISSDHSLFLNHEAKGTTADTSILQKRLSDLFRRRAKEGAFRIGTNEVEKTVFVKGARKLPFDGVIRIVDVVRRVGADPIMLQIDDLEP